MKQVSITCLIILCFLFSCEDKTGKGIIPGNLSCEYSVNPLGVENRNPKLSWKLFSSEHDQYQTAYRILVSSNIENLRRNIGDLWDSKKVMSDQSLHVIYEGKKLESREKCWWKVCVWDKNYTGSVWSEPAYWEMGLLNPGDWNAKWIGNNCNEAPLFRKELKITKKVVNARVFISGLGYYELSINGSKIGDHVLDPGQTDYEQRTFYVVYDVTDRIKKGSNVLGVILGNGWYNQTVVNHGKFGWKDVVYGKPRFILQLYVEYSDGTGEMFNSDGTWKTSTGPIISDNIYLGEFYDARLEKPGWDKPGYNDSSWTAVQISEKPGERLESQKLQPIKKISVVKPVKISNPRPGVYVYDMGLNFSGWVKLRMRAERGTTMQLRFAETAFDNGMIDPASTGVYATNVVQTDKYIFKGEDLEIWEPRFTYHGFRFVEMTGYYGEPTLDNIEGIIVNTALEETGSFECSDPMINKIHQTICHTTLANIHGIITDCPHRERCQWLGDILAEMASYNFNSPLLLTKFVEDIETGRRGGVPNHISPGRRTGGTASSDWGSTFIQLPYYLYLYYGDISVALKHYEGMTFFMDYLQSIAKDYVIDEGWGDLFEPGSVRSKRTPAKLTSTAFFYYDAALMYEIAKVLNKQADIDKYSNLMSEIKNSFIRNFYKVDRKTFGSQTADALALYFGLVPEGEEKHVAGSMKKDILENHSGHHSTGHMGTRYIYGELSRFGFGDLAQSMLNQTSYPSFGDIFQRGATTVWEYWGEKIIDETSNGTRSRSHPFQGGFDVWFYNGIAGINPDPEIPGFKHIILKPQVFGSLNYAKAQFNSLYGLIKSEWELKDSIFSWNIEIPVNTTADVFVQAEHTDRILKNEGQAIESGELTFLRQEGIYSVFKAGSGQYRLIYRLKN